MNGKGSKAKGASGERECQDELYPIFGAHNCWRGYQRITNHGVADVITPLLWCEVKRTETLQMHPALEQAAKDCPENLFPCVRHRRNHKSPVYIMYAKDFLRLIQDYWRLKEQEKLGDAKGTGLSDSKAGV